jgi:twitching motility protein PilI
MARAGRVNLRAFQQELATRLQAKTAAQVGAARLGLVSGGEHWLVRLGDSSEVLTVPPLAHVPLTKPWYVGLANVRGSLFGVIDFAAFNGKEATPTGFMSRLLLLGQRFSELRAGLLVQQVIGLRHLGEMEACGRAADAQEWIGESWRDAAGTVWHELDLLRLAQDPRFLMVGV